MYQAHGNELLNQKELGQKESVVSDSASAPDPLARMPEHPLFVATRRLIGALDRLEGNLRRARPGAADEAREENTQVALFREENIALKQERERLNILVARLQRQYNELQRTAATVYDKLDHSIRKLTEIIEE